MMIPFKERVIPVQIAPYMKRLSLLLCFLIATASVFTQTNPGDYKSQEVSDVDGTTPVLIMNLPDWETVKGQAKITNKIGDVRASFGEPPVLAGIDLNGGAEAAYADYSAGRLLLIEYPTPQASTAADTSIQAALPASPGVIYKRIGNYNAFVFNASDPDAANALLEKIDYGKTVQWLGEDPYFLQRFERYIAMQGRDMVITTVLFIAGILLSAALIGILAGFIYFRFREQERAQWHAYSDAGGLTRLNLDELSE